MREPFSTWMITVTAVLVLTAWLLAGLRGAFIALGLATFACYGIDKWQARRDGRRISETTLHILALCGGTPGAALGQIVFRHKTQKREFRLVFFAIAAMQAVALTVWGFR